MLTHKPLGFGAVHQDQRTIEANHPQVRHRFDPDEALAPTLLVRILRLGGVPVSPANSCIQLFARHSERLAIAAQYGGDVGAGRDNHGRPQDVGVLRLFHPAYSVGVR